MGTNDEPSNIVLAAPIFYFLLGAAGLGGAGTFGLLGQGIEQSAVQACYDNAQIALDVAAQHGQELVEIRQALVERTRYRYTSDEAEKDKRAQNRIDNIQNDRLAQVERDIERHDRLHNGREK